MNFTNEFDSGPEAHWDPHFWSVFFPASIRTGCTALALPWNCMKWRPTPRSGYLADMQEPKQSYNMSDMLSYSYPFFCCLSTTVLARVCDGVLWCKRWRSEFPSSMGGGRACDHGDTCSPYQRIFVYGHRLTHTQAVTGMEMHATELHCGKLNQYYHGSEMGGKMMTLACLEAYRMPGSLLT